MTQHEIVQLLQYANEIYPFARMTGEQMTRISMIWMSELGEHPAQKVGKAFKMATLKSPERMPSLPLIMLSLGELEMMPGRKSDAQAFADSHCGRTPEEWQRIKALYDGPEGKKRLERNMERLAEIIGAMKA